MRVTWLAESGVPGYQLCAQQHRRWKVIGRSCPMGMLFLCVLGVWRGVFKYYVDFCVYKYHVVGRGYMHGVTHLYECHDSFICVSWLIYMCDVTHASWMMGTPILCVSWDTIVYVTWRIYMRDMTHTSCTMGTPFLHVCGVVHLEVWHESAMCVTWLYVGHDSYILPEGYRVAKTHRIPYLYRLFSAKVTYI